MSQPSPWLSYVPPYIAETLLAQPAADLVGREARFEAVALFVDISGFTPMSEAFSRLGRASAEELTQILNGYFTPMIERIHAYGGLVGRFAGDALTALFRCERRTRPAAVRRALQCALEMQAEMGRYAAIQTRVGTFSLAIKAGLALGPVFTTTAGDPDLHQEYVIAGRVLDLCAEAEHHAARGEVVAHTALLAYAGRVQGLERRGDFVRLTGLARRPARRPLPAPAGLLSDLAQRNLAAFLHPVIAQRLRDGQALFLNEHRQVTVIFARFEGFDYDGDPAVGARLQEYLLAAMRVAQRYDGYLSQVDMGDKGSKYVVLFGAPIAHENDEERAVRCALELSRLPHCVARFGVNTGRLYCGSVGSLARQEYTVMGDAMNLAARLMQAAQPRQILAGETTHQPAAGRFTWRALEPMTVKGKAAPVAVFESLGEAEQSSYRLQPQPYTVPMVGRGNQLQIIAERLELVRQGRGQVVALTAEAGLGKSRLVAEVIRLAAAQGVTAYGGECPSHGTRSSYLVWRNIWRGLLDLEPAWDDQQAQVHLAAWLAGVDPALTPRLPLLAGVLNLPLPENELTLALDAKLRKDSLEDLLSTCLTTAARAAPRLLVLEDCHWIDPLSLDLLERLGRGLTDLPVLVLLAYRPPEGDSQPLRSIPRWAHYTELSLAEFSPAEAEELIRSKLARQLGGDLAAWPAGAVDRIVARAQGNPFYIDELVNYLHERGYGLVEAPADLDLPDSLHHLILSRIDQLAEDQKATLRVASVIGRLFRASWLWRAYPELGEPRQIEAQLRALQAVDLTPLDKAEPEVEYLFKHVLTQEVTYESMALATREFLHEHVAQFIEAQYGAEAERYVEMLAFQYGRSRNLAKQRLYFRRAADAARALFANAAALSYYQRLLPLVSGPEQLEVWAGLGEVQQLTGQWAEAEVSFRQALALAAGQPAAEAEAQLRLGYLLWYRTEYAEALTWLARAQVGFETLGDRRGYALALGRAGLVYRYQGELAQAQARFERQAAIAAELNDPVTQAEALGHIGIIHYQRGEAAQAGAFFQKQLALAEAASQRRKRLEALGNLSLLDLERGDYPGAHARLAQVLAQALEIGDRRNSAIAAINLGEVYRPAGHLSEAGVCYAYALAAGLEVGDRLLVLTALTNWALAAGRQGEAARAEQLLNWAEPLARRLSNPVALADVLGGRAALAEAGAPAEALAAAQAARDAARAAELRDLEVKAWIFGAAARVRVGEWTPAEAAAEARGQLAQFPEPAHQAVLSEALWRWTGAAEDRAAAARLYRELAAQTPTEEVRHSLLALTGEAWPAVVLPAPPEVCQRAAQDTTGLWAKTAALLAAG